MAKIYQEEKGASFTHEGKKYDLNKAFRLTAKKPVKQIQTSKMSWVLPYTKTQAKRVKKADISKPLLITKTKDGRWVPVDGAHRLKKATKLGAKKLPTIVISKRELNKSQLS